MEPRESPLHDEKTLQGQPEVAQVLSAAPRKRVAVFPTIPGYEVLAELGRGGMGVVYKARHVALKRIVALKMIKSGLYAGEADIARFEAEAQAAARLQHPNIVQIYEFGAHDERPFFALEYVEGGTLAKHLDGKPQPEKDAACVVETLARAIHFAHQRGVLHRDLKPANILLSTLSTGRGPTLPEESTVKGATVTSEAGSIGSRPTAIGQLGGTLEPRESRSLEATPSELLDLTAVTPKVTDFGLAKLLAADEAAGASGGSDVTPSGAVLGTPGFMAPEQAQTGKTPIGPAADVYGLGAILYVALTGRPPFLAASPVETILQVLNEEPVSPRQLRPALSRDIETICLRCLEKDPARRYASAEALADDLRRYLNHEPILARPAGVVERTVKWARRRPAMATLVGFAVLGVVVLAVMNYLLSLAQHEEKEARKLAERRELQAQTEERKAKENFELAAQAVEEFLTKISDHPHLKDFDLEDLRKDLLETALGFHRRFVEKESANPYVRLEQGKAYLRLGKILNEVGDKQAALEHYRKAQEIIAPLVAAHPDTPAYLREWGTSWNRLHSVLAQLGKRPEALSAIEKAIELREKLTAGPMPAAADRNDLAISVMNLAVFEKEKGDKLFVRALALQEQVVGEQPKQASFRGDLARTHYNRAFSLERAPARAAFAQAARLYRELVEESTRPSAILPILAKCYGNMASLADSAAEAEKLHLEAAALLSKAARKHPSITFYRSDLARTYANLASCVATNKEARAYSLEALALQKELVEQHPHIDAFRFDYGKTLYILGVLAFQVKKEDEARRYLQDAHDQQTHLVAENPKRREYRVALAETCLKLGDVAQKRDERWNGYAEAILEARTVLAAGSHVEASRTLTKALRGRAELCMGDGDYKRALLDWQELARMPPPAKEDTLRLLLCRARLGLYVTAAEEADALAGSVKEGADCYALARVYALCLAAAQSNSRLEPSARETTTAEYARRALDCLEKARDAGFFDSEAVRAEFEADPDFARLRARPEGRALLRER